ncbi:MAG: hypothetical protein V8K32_13190 [Candidatus Electrothrix gigas]
MPAHNMPQKKAIIRIKPNVSKSVHFFSAPFIWTAVGIMLMVRGLHWIGLSLTLWLLFIVLLVGTLKSLMILDRSAKKTLHRIMLLNEKSCIGAVYSWKTWLFVVLMMSLGMILRRMTEPGLFFGTVYLAVGWGLLLSSRHGWKRWLQELRELRQLRQVQKK